MSIDMDRMFKMAEMEERAVAIAIDRNGGMLREVIDDMPFNHAVMFNYFAKRLGLFYEETQNCCKAATFLTENGLVVLQIRDGFCVGYFPESILDIQYELIKKELENKGDYYYQYDEEMEGFATREEFLGYVGSLRKERRR